MKSLVQVRTSYERLYKEEKRFGKSYASKESLRPLHELTLYHPLYSRTYLRCDYCVQETETKMLSFVGMECDLESQRLYQSPPC